MKHWLDKVVTLLAADTSNLRELARIAGADPRTFYRGIRLEELELAGQDVEGMEFSQPMVAPTKGEGQLNLDLLYRNDESGPAAAAHRIKSVRRQEERAAMLLSEFLENRSRGMQIVQSYSHDRAMLTNSVLQVLVEIRMRETAGKQYSNLQVARKVSGRFAKSEDKRSVLAYFFARYLHKYPDIRAWLRGKSITKLSREEQQEFNRYLEEPPPSPARAHA